MNRKAFIGASVVVVLLIAAGIAALIVSQRAPRDEASLLDLLEDAVDALYLPGRTVETAAARLETPEAAAVFVRDRVSETDYAGAVFSPGDVLRQRVGNRMDRARLLVALIEAQGGTARIMSDGGTVARAQLAEPETPEALMRLVARLQVDTEGAETRAMEGHRDRLLAMRDEIDASEALLGALLGPETALDEPPAAAAPHLWVAGEDAQGKAFSLSLGPDPTPEAGAPVAAEPTPFGLKLVGIDGDGARQVLLDHSGPVASATSLSFQPVVGPVEAFGEPPAPETVPLWAPVLVSGGALVSGTPFSPSGEAVPVLEPGRPPLLPDPDGEAAPAPRIDDLRAVSLDASGFPEVRATLTGRVPDGLSWQAPWIDIFDNGVARAARIAAFPREGRNVVLAIDASASMAQGGRVLAARDLARVVVAGLPAGTRLSIAGLQGEGPVVTRRPGGIGPLDLSALQEAVDAALVIGDDYSLASMLDTLLDDPAGPTDIILIGDGALGPSGPDRLAALLERRRARLFTVAIDAPGDAFLPLGDVIAWTTTETDADAVAARLSGARGSQVTFAWQAPEDARAGETRTVEFRPVAGGDGAASLDYVVPDARQEPPGALASLQLEITLPGGETVARPLFHLGPEADPWALESAYRLTVSPGPATETALVAAAMEEWLALARARAASETDPPPRLDTTGFAALQKVASLVAYRAVVTGVSPAITSPVVILERYAPFPQGDDLAVRRTLDLVADGGLLDGGGRRAGLAVAAAEAALNGGASVNDRLRGAQDRVVFQAGEPLPDWARSRGLDADGAIVASADAGAAWVLGEGGRLEARLFEPVSKGASDVMIAAQFAQIRSRLEMVSLVSGSAGSVGGVSGVMHGGLVGLLDQNLRLWCYSSVMMGYVADRIANRPTPGDGDPAVWKARALDLCELANADGLARAYAKSIGIGMAGGLLGDQLGALTGGLLTEGLARRAGEIYRIFPRTLSPGETGAIGLGWNVLLWMSDISGALNASLAAAPDGA